MIIIDKDTKKFIGNEINTFQADVITKEDFINSLIIAFEPFFDKNEDDATVFLKYDWVTIETQWTYIGLSLKSCDFSGLGIKMEDFRNCRKKNYFRAWRFAFGNSVNTTPDKNYIKMIFEKYKIKKPTVKEMYNFYYKD